ncbi:MAG: ribosome assembly factor SBDS, partial [Candidatus Aenigmatarchaeota archaeon]
MISIEKAVIARITKSGKHFEILVDPELALELRKGKEIPIDSLLAVQAIFKDAKKGEKAGEKELESVFGTSNTSNVAEEIIKKGEIQLTTEQRRRAVEEKKKQIAETIAREGINPQTNLPHPVSRIMNAMEQAKISIDPFKPAEEQIEMVLNAIQPIIPVTIKRVQIVVKIPLQWAGKASAVLRGMVSIKKEEWRSDGWYAVIEIPAGLQGEILAKL